MAVRIGGECIGVRVDGAALRAWLSKAYRSCAAATADIEVRGREVRRGGRVVRRARSGEELRAWLEWTITSEALKRLRERSLILHAAWVAKGRRSVLIAGPHGAGKTTLAMALELRRGWRVLSDDVVLLDASGAAEPLERPVSVKPGTALPELGRATQGWWPSLLPRRRPKTLPRIDAVLLIDRRRGALRVDPVPPGRAVAAIGRFVWNFTSRPREALAAVAALCRVAAVRQLSGGTINERCEACQVAATAKAGDR